MFANIARRCMQSLKVPPSPNFIIGSTPLPFPAPIITLRMASTAAHTGTNNTILDSEHGTFDSSTTLVSPQWLHAQLARRCVSIIDASWYMPAAGRGPKAEFGGCRIPGAVFFDIDGIAHTPAHPAQAPGIGVAISDGGDTGGLKAGMATLPHMLPDEETFATAMAALGVSKEKGVVVYDTAGIFSAPRVWWTLKAFGHPRVAVLNGGLPAWIAAGFPADMTPTTAVNPGAPVPQEKWAFPADLVVSMAEVQRISDERCAHPSNPSLPVHVDARPAGRFTGEAPEPRPGLPSGHVPGSISVPFSSVLTTDTPAKLRSPAEIEAILRSAGVDIHSEAPVVTSCGSGITACVVALALSTCGRPFTKTSLYDGSWTEYAAHPGAKIARE